MFEAQSAELDVAAQFSVPEHAENDFLTHQIQLNQVNSDNKLVEEQKVEIQQNDDLLGLFFGGPSQPSAQVP